MWGLIKIINTGKMWREVISENKRKSVRCGSIYAFNPVVAAPAPGGLKLD